MLIMQYIYIYIYKAFSYYKIYTIYIYVCIFNTFNQQGCIEFINNDSKAFYNRLFLI